MEPEALIFYRFGIALLIGFLIGLQREYDYDVTAKPEERTFAGVRTFSLIALTGCTAAFLSDLFDSALLSVSIFFSLSIMITVAYFLVARQGSTGMTTEVAALLTALVGALAIMLAWTVMFGRVLIEVAVVHAPLLQSLWLPMTAAGLLGLGYGLYLYFSPRADDEEDVEVTNPFELGPAITFGLLYGFILLATNAAEQFFGSAGLYLSSIISGLADVDAITLTTAELSRNGTIESAEATRAIVLAVVSNTFVKGFIVLSTGSAALRRAILPGFVLTLAAAIILAFVI